MPYHLPDDIRRTALALSFLLLALFLAALIGSSRKADADQALAYLRAHPPATFSELSTYFEDLARDEGALYAYDVLRRAELPPNTDLHLLGHVVGDALYKERGVGGIVDCTQEFRNACSHSIVIGALDEFGDAGLPLITDACRQAPGGRGAYTMCFHGLGHGVFASTGHRLEETARHCRKTGTTEYRNREYIECFGGAIMELTGGTGHDQVSLDAARERYFSESNPLAPCDGALIPEDVKSICYLYLTPRLFTHQGGDLGHPGEREFRQAFELCERIPASQSESRRACFEGVGKELPTLAQARDIRRIDELDAGQLAAVSSWCALPASGEAREACTRSVVQSLFWGGENNPRAAATFCGVAKGGGAREACYDELIAANSYYNASDTAARKEVCALLPSSRSSSCLSFSADAMP